MSWIYLLIAIFSEVAGTTCMKLSEGFTRTVPSILIFVFYAGAFTMMTLAIKKIEVSIVYAIWSGIGTALIATIGILIFHERATMLKLISMVLIIVGVLGLNLGARLR
jgi:small multidrug resistance pump